MASEIEDFYLLLSQKLGEADQEFDWQLPKLQEIEEEISRVRSQPEIREVETAPKMTRQEKISFLQRLLKKLAPEEFLMNETFGEKLQSARDTPGFKKFNAADGFNSSKVIKSPESNHPPIWVSASSKMSLIHQTTPHNFPSSKKIFQKDKDSEPSSARKVLSYDS